MLQVQNLGKRYAGRWLFKNVSLEILKGEKWAVLGPNGSGKSTFMQIIFGSVAPSEGLVFPHSNAISYSFTAPYLDLQLEFTVIENINWHFKFRNTNLGASLKDIVDLLEWQKVSLNTPYQRLSSGMQQRLKSLLAFTTDADLYLFDEPLTNMDDNGLIWYQSMWEKFLEQKTVIVASNDKREFSYCNKFFKIN